jgi:hypothetical protein
LLCKMWNALFREGPYSSGLTDANPNPQGAKHDCELAEMKGTVEVELIT